MKKSHYKSAKHRLQVGLVRFQRDLIESGLKVLVIFEGRDAAGKDGTIKRIREYLSPRDTRIVALGKPSDRDRSAWYFQRYAPHLPVAGELVLFNRSWYNRAGVEHVMGFCSDEEYKGFLRDVCPFEKLLLDSGIQLLKYYLDISKEEQIRRLASRRRNPLKQWKSSPIDAAAVEYWDHYSQARDAMLEATHREEAPWTIVRADDKRSTRVNVMRHLLSQLRYSNYGSKFEPPDPEVIFGYERGSKLGLAP